MSLSKVSKSLLCAIIAFGISACGGGSSSSGGMPGVSAIECIDVQQIFGSSPPQVRITNTCSFVVNIASRQGDDPFGPVTAIPANSMIDIVVRPGSIVVGACRPPSVPIEPSGLQFRCSNI